MPRPLPPASRKAAGLLAPAASIARPSFLCSHCAVLVAASPARTFTTGRRHGAAMGESGAARDLNFRLPRALAMRTRMKDLHKTNTPTDMGRLPQSMVWPPSKDLPPWFGPTVLQRLKLRWLHARMAVVDWFGLFYMQYWDAKKDAITGKRKNVPLQLNERCEIARTLHQTFNQALADGDMRKLEEVCCDGLLERAKKRLDARKRLGVHQEEWSLQQYEGVRYSARLEKWPLTVLLPNPSTKVVSDRLMALPMPETFIRQCTVRIRSLQHYTLANRTSDKQLNKHTEYVVIQRLVFRGEPSPWRIWGTVEPNTVAEIQAGGGKSLTGSAAESLVERFQNTMSSMSPGSRM